AVRRHRRRGAQSTDRPVITDAGIAVHFPLLAAVHAPRPLAPRHVPYRLRAGHTTHRPSGEDLATSPASGSARDKPLNPAARPIGMPAHPAWGDASFRPCWQTAAADDKI